MKKNPLFESIVAQFEKRGILVSCNVPTEYAKKRSDSMMEDYAQDVLVHIYKDLKTKSGILAREASINMFMMMMNGSYSTSFVDVMELGEMFGHQVKVDMKIPAPIIIDGGELAFRKKNWEYLHVIDVVKKENVDDEEMMKILKQYEEIQGLIGKEKLDYNENLKEIFNVAINDLGKRYALENY